MGVTERPVRKRATACLQRIAALLGSIGERKRRSRRRADKTISARRSIPPFRRKPLFEILESRLLLSSDPLAAPGWFEPNAGQADAEVAALFAGLGLLVAEGGEIDPRHQIVEHLHEIAAVEILAGDRGVRRQASLLAAGRHPRRPLRGRRFPMGMMVGTPSSEIKLPIIEKTKRSHSFDVVASSDNSLSLPSAT